VEAYGDELSRKLDVNLSAENVAAIRLRKEFLLKHGFLPADFDLDQWIDPGPLTEAQKLLKERGQQKKQNARAERTVASA
jgi:ABC-type nitrate/sulfonate/bicarbonate transport system substrate-binding protein